MAIGLVTGTWMPKPDPETHLLVEAIQRSGFAVEVRRWQDEIDWSRYAQVVIRTPWDYFQQLPSFLDWANRVSLQTSLANPPTVMAWNSHKSYLRELAANGISVMPTCWIKKGEPNPVELLLATDWGEVVVKPAVSIGAIDTTRGAADSVNVHKHLESLVKRDDVLVQPFAESICSDGEVSLIFFADKFSHAVRKSPKRGDFRVQDLYGGQNTAYTLTPEQLRLAQRALALIPGRTLYSRVDLIEFDGCWVVMELELIEPELFLGYSPDAASNFASAICGRHITA